MIPGNLPEPHDSNYIIPSHCLQNEQYVFQSIIQALNKLALKEISTSYSTLIQNSSQRPYKFSISTLLAFFSPSLKPTLCIHPTQTRHAPWRLPLSHHILTMSASDFLQHFTLAFPMKLCHFVSCITYIPPKGFYIIRIFTPQMFIEHQSSARHISGAKGIITRQIWFLSFWSLEVSTTKIWNNCIKNWLCSFISLFLVGEQKKVEFWKMRTCRCKDLQCKKKKLQVWSLWGRLKLGLL
jgi:hypothetical protein